MNNDKNLTEDQVKLLKRALDIYAYFIDQHRNDQFDVTDSNEFYWMRDKLSHIIGVDVT